MGEIININGSARKEFVQTDNDLVEIANGILLDTQDTLKDIEMISMPLDGLAGLGAGISSLLPAMRTVTQSTTTNMEGLFRVVNAGAGDDLKSAGNGIFWGYVKKADGTSELARLKPAELRTTSRIYFDKDRIYLVA